ncbi:hypothetical protein COM90_30485 [Bacillus thuringiensis]|uniref:ATP-grasp domain-containing protein n=1 Tax=Bacillus thuringiensis TaxID=1428 RepID=A0AB36U6L5_BACTU|nr:ATP-grasp domain-containing protein [Bacillus thuringiensis]PEE61712.1 hypothetical protein COM74_28165 [Bacillus thuringiensis]PEE85127.1 hypothetical protein COM90_30485 [Bacillus thuringiensis]PFM96862.1 hypothetical protein COJ61_00415 [Bacillus thuringiensis]
MAILVLDRNPFINIPLLLKETKEEIVLLTDENYTGSIEGYTLVEKFPNFETNANVILRTLKLGKNFSFTSVIALRELSILPAAIIREKLGIPGQSIKSANMFRDKVIMKSVASRAVEVPQFQRIKHPIDVYDFIQKHQYPVVVKPSDGVSSKDTFILHSESDLIQLYSSETLNGFEVEKYIEGEMYTVDGLIKNGELFTIWIARYINDCISFKHGNGVSRIELDEKNILRVRLINFTRKLLNVMDLPNNTTFHLEVFHDKDDHLIFCEIASRTGGNVEHITKVAFNRSITESAVISQCGLSSSDEWNREVGLLGFINPPPKEGMLEDIPKSLPFDWVRLYEPLGKPGTTYQQASNSSYRIATIVIEGRTETEIIERLNKVTIWFEQNCKWS